MQEAEQQADLTLRHFDRVESLEESWRCLEAAPECSIHQTYDWCRCWIEKTNARPLLITGEFASGPQRGKTAFILPLCVEKTGPLRIARYIGAAYNNINFGVFSQEFMNGIDAARMRKIWKDIAAMPLDVDLFMLDRQPRQWRGMPHPIACLATVENQNHAFQVTLDCAFEDVLARGNAKRRRKKFRTSERRLEEWGGYEYVTATGAEDAQSLLDTFFRQKAARFEVQGIPDVFEDTKIKSFFHRLTKDSIDQQRKMIELCAIRLKKDGTICAISALSRKDGHVICQFSSIATGELEAASSGELLFYLMIRSACEEKAEIFDFGIGDEQYKRSWCDVETVHFDAVLPVTAKGYLGAVGARWLIDSKRFLKSNKKIFALAKAVRIRLKQKR